MRPLLSISVKIGVAVLAVWTGVQAAAAADRAGGAPVVSPLEAPAPAPVSQNLLDVQQQLDELRRQLEHLQNQIEVQSHQLEVLSAQQRRQGSDLDRRMQALESAAKAPAATPPAAPSAAEAPDVRAVEQREYDAAFNLLKQGRFADAIKAFQAFLAAHPNSVLADNAQYWIAQSNYVQGNYGPALEEFQRVLAQYPNSAKAPDALLKVGFLYDYMNQPDKARKILQDVIKRYPKTESQKAAEERLRKMGARTH